jgi:SAM-dependent methyltransferase
MKTNLDGVPAAGWAELAAALRHHGWPLALETYRQAGGLTHEPWLPPVPHEDPIFSLLHRGEVTGPVPADLRAVLDRLGLPTPLPCYLTAVRDLLAVGDHHDRPERCHAYLGKDGLQIVDRLLSHRGSGRALDCGSGSGLTSVALAAAGFQVTAVDIDPACVTATRATAALNGFQDRIDPREMSIADALLDGGDGDYAMIAANPPGAPVPTTVNYWPAGNGGSDGMGVIRTILTGATRALAPGGVLVMRFESVGDGDRPFAVAEIDEIAADCSVLLSVEDRLPMRVRSGISARWAAPHNPGLEAGELLDILDTHAESLGATYFYTCFAVVRRDAKAGRQVWPFNRATANRPTGLSELRWRPYRRLFTERAADVAAARRRADDARVMAEVFADAVASDQINSRSLYYFMDETRAAKAH